MPPLISEVAVYWS